MIKSISGALAALALLTSASSAAAEIVARTADSFTLRFAVPMETTSEDVANAVRNIGEWWDGAHTYSGDAANMTLELKPGGCFCEALPNGETFEHGLVTSITADQIVLDAPLGPMNGHTSRADLTFSWPAAGAGTMVTLTFVVEGPEMGAAADPVDAVMSGQFARFVRYVEYGEP